MALERTKRALKKLSTLTEKGKLRAELKQNLSLTKRIPITARKKTLKKIKEEVSNNPASKAEQEEILNRRRFAERLGKTEKRITLEAYLNQYGVEMKVKRLTSLKKIDEIIEKIEELRAEGAAPEEIKKFIEKKLKSNYSKTRKSNSSPFKTLNEEDLIKALLILLLFFALIAAVYSLFD